MKPTIDRRKCINDTMSANVCTIDGYAYNKDQNECVKGWFFPPLGHTYNSYTLWFLINILDQISVLVGNPVKSLNVLVQMNIMEKNFWLKNTFIY